MVAVEWDALYGATPKQLPVSSASGFKINMMLDPKLN
jgi:hypothetical protein